MSKILIIAEHAGGQLNPSTAKCVSCASNIDGAAIEVLVMAVDPAAVAEQAASINGVSKVITLSDATFDQPTAAGCTRAVLAVAEGYTHIFGPSTTFGKDLMPRVAAKLGVSQVSDIMDVMGSHEFKRPIYAGNAIASVQAPADQTVVATVRTASYQAAGNADAAPVEASSASFEVPAHTRFVGLESGGGDRPDLQTAAKVISGGRALGSEEKFKLIYDLADAFKAGVGASRAAVDAGYAPNDMQVGQTGKIIAPDLYIAIGISGAIQHLTGIKDAGTIVAINKDPEAPIFEVADIGLVGDLFNVVPELQAAIQK